MNYKIILISWALAHFLKGLLFTLKLFFDPIHNRPTWVNRPDLLHFVFSVTFWFFEEGLIIFYTKKQPLKVAFYILIMYIKRIIVLFGVMYLSINELNY